MSKRKMIWVHGTESNQVFRTFVPEEKHSNQLPMMTWADWELLQELHKARAGKGEPVALQWLQPTVIETGRTEGVSDAVHAELDKEEEELIESQLQINELQDQIKDWESKCGALEDKIQHMADSLLNQARVIESHQEQNAQLSKSLQHYRNAFFADQGNVVVTAEARPGSCMQPEISKLGGAKGILR